MKPKVVRTTISLHPGVVTTSISLPQTLLTVGSYKAQRDFRSFSSYVAGVIRADCAGELTRLRAELAERLGTAPESEHAQIKAAAQSVEEELFPIEATPDLLAAMVMAKHYPTP